MRQPLSRAFKWQAQSRSCWAAAPPSQRQRKSNMMQSVQYPSPLGAVQLLAVDQAACGVLPGAKMAKHVCGASLMKTTPTTRVCSADQRRATTLGHTNTSSRASCLDRGRLGAADSFCFRIHGSGLAARNQDSGRRIEEPRARARERAANEPSARASSERESEQRASC